MPCSSVFVAVGNMGENATLRPCQALFPLLGFPVIVGAEVEMSASLEISLAEALETPALPGFAPASSMQLMNRDSGG